MHLEGLISIQMKVYFHLPDSLSSPFAYTDGFFFLPLLVYNHVLRLDLGSLQWSLIDNYGDIPGVRMGMGRLCFPIKYSRLTWV